MSSIKNLIKKEEKRQEETITLIPSENYTSKEVRHALASKLVNKYSEGYPGKRYYQGNKIIDEIENIAIENAKKLFGVPHANVQAYSGSPANSAVYFGLLDQGDTLMGLALSSGGHLTHGHPKVTFSGKYFNSVQYVLNKGGYIDYDEVESLATKHKPKLIVAGLTAYSRKLEWKKFSDIAEKVGAMLLADISHIAGLVVGGVHESPTEFAHVITTTTHKTLRGPRGALIMVTQKGLDKNPDMGKKINSAVFPGLQGGPHDNQTAAIAIALEEASDKLFGTYANQIVANAKALSENLQKFDFNVVSGGTDNHLMVLDLRKQNVLGKDAAILLEDAGIVTNYNTVPFDPNPPFNPSGLRIGTPAVTTRGMKISEMRLIAHYFNEVLNKKTDPIVIYDKVKKLCKKFPCP